MHVDIRLYSGFAGQAGRLTAVRHELEPLLRSVQGLRRFQLLETSEGLALVTEAETRAACDECARRAAAWMSGRMPSLAGYQPLAVAGEVIIDSS
jgi:hypothetical protein